MKKLFISADLEGVSGVSSWEETRYGRPGYDAACPPADPGGRRGLPRGPGAGIYGIGQRRS